MAALLIAAISLVGISTSTVLADDPEPPYMYVTWPSGDTWGSCRIYFVDDDLVTTGPIDGWCASKTTYIYVNKHYAYDLYDYYADYYPDDLADLPEGVKWNKGWERDWNRITYIMNNVAPGATDHDVQQAVWYYSDGIVPEAGSLAEAMVNAAVPYGNYIPPEDGWKPIIVDMGVCVQLLFYLTPPVPPVPEMPPILLFGAGVLGLGGFVWYRKRHAVAA